MRLRLLPLALVLGAAALAPARIAAADDGAIIKRTPIAPIAGTPFWSNIEIEEPPRKAKSPLLVILGAIVGSLGAAGAVTGGVLLATGSGGCPALLDKNGNAIRSPSTRDITDEKTGQKIGTLSSDVSSCAGDDPRQRIGLTTLLVGAGVAAAGLTAVLVGIQPRADEDEASRIRLVPTLAVGPTGGSLTWRF